MNARLAGRLLRINIVLVRHGLAATVCGGKSPTARSANAGAAPGSRSRTPTLHRACPASGSIRSSVARVTQASPGLLRG